MAKREIIPKWVIDLPLEQDALESAASDAYVERYMAQALGAERLPNLRKILEQAHKAMAILENQAAPQTHRIRAAERAAERYRRAEDVARAQLAASGD